MAGTKDEKEIIRQWRLLSYLFQSPWPRTRRDLAGRYGVVKKTIGRDIGDLEEAGFPILRKKEGQTETFTVDRDFQKLPPMTLSPLELMALYLARAQLQHLSDAPFREELDQLCDKIGVLLPKETRRYFEKIQRFARPHLRGQKRASVKREVLRELREAILESQTCIVRYRTPGRARDSRFRVQPQRLLTHHGGLYLIAWNPHFEQFNTLATERIREIERLDKIFAPKPEDEIDAAHDQAFGIFASAPFKLRLRFTPEIAAFIQERSWHPSERMRTNNDGSLSYSAEVSGDLEVESWVMSYGRNVEVLEPDWLRERVAAHAHALAAQYADTVTAAAG